MSAGTNTRNGHDQVNVSRCHRGVTRTFSRAGTNYIASRRAPWRPPVPSSGTAAPLQPARPANTLKTLRISPFSAPRWRAGRFFPAMAFLARRLQSARVRGAESNQFRADSTAIFRCQRLPKTPRLAGCGATSPLFFFLAAVRPQRVSAARRRTIGTKVSKSTGLGTCRSKPAWIAAATSPLEA